MADQHPPERPPFFGAYCMQLTANPWVNPMDEFAQTRPPDDLFDDDFVPIPGAEYPRPEPMQNPDSNDPSQQDPPPPNAPSGPRGPNGGNGSNSRGGSSSRAPDPSPHANNVGNAGHDNSNLPNGTGPAGPQRSHGGNSVRGDRSLTGGPAREKLTDEQLEERMRNMRLKNAKILAAHEKSTADQEAFEAREKAAAERRKEDRQNRQAMMGEREKNRQRKLQAQGGREWDSEKKDEDFGPAFRGARRGAHGGVSGSRYAKGETAPSSVAQWVESQAVVIEETGRGGRGGRGRGRGGRGGGPGYQTQQAPPIASDFPELPKPNKQTWAEQMEDGNTPA